MRQLLAHETTSAFRIVKTCFRENASFQFIFGKQLAGWRFNLFTRQCIRFAQKKNGAFIADNKQAVALVVPVTSGNEQVQPISRWQSLFIIPLKRLIPVSRFQRKVLRFLPREPHLHLLLMAVNAKQNGISTIISMRDDLFALSAVMQLPIYAQTSSRRVRNFYETFGFTVYAEVPIPGSEDYFYFVKRIPGAKPVLPAQISS